jgi:riboflavin-specific deaminase-like protein
VRLERLYPTPGEATPDGLVSGLDLASRALPDRPYLLLNMVSSLDGKATLGGNTRGLSGDVDRALFHHLRTQADAVMVGAGTVRVERYGRMVRRPELREKRREQGLEPDPLAVIVSARLALPSDLPLLQDPDSRVVIATASDAELEGVAARVEYLRTGDDLPLLMARLRADYGVRSVLCEGGPTLNAHLLAAGLVDELFLALSAKLVGGLEALTIVTGRALVEPLHLELLWLFEGDGDLFSRWRVRR